MAKVQGCVGESTADIRQWRKYRDVLARVQWTFANWRNSSEYVGETTVNFRRLS
jgi:hypothetical protein